jgi:hypothetical protein
MYFKMMHVLTEEEQQEARPLVGTRPPARPHMMFSHHDERAMLFLLLNPRRTNT